MDLDVYGPSADAEWSDFGGYRPRGPVGERCFCIDSTVAGEPIYEVLAKVGTKVRGYPFTQKSKTALVGNLAIKLERRELILPTAELCPELVDEMEALEYSVADHGNVRAGAPYGYHDDCVIGLALAAWSLKRGDRTPTIPVGPTLFVDGVEYRSGGFL